MNLFNLYNKMILKELDVQAGFIIGGRNLNNIRYADNAGLIAGTENYKHSGRKK